MRGEHFTIAKGKYKVFQGDNSTGEPMDEMTEQQLRAWLLTRGVSETQVNYYVEQTDDAESITITLP